MQDNEKKPALRFKGFTDPWEQRKLGELGKARSGIGFPDAEQGGKEGVPFYKVSDMNKAENEHEMVISNNYVTTEQITRRGWKPIDNVPAIFFAKVGAAVLLNRKRLCRFPFLLDNNTMAYSMDQNTLDADFAKTLFETIDLTSLVQIGALPSYNAGDVEDIKVSIPRINEQKQIAAYFRNLDRLITLHQRKYEKLVNIKKSMLDKMFPKNGASVPEIRFKGFTDLWEQRKLGEIAVFSKGVGYSKNDLCEEGTPIILYGRLYTKYETCIFDVDTFVKEKAGGVYSKGGEVIVPASGETAEDISIASVVVKPGILLGGDLNIVSPTAEYDSAFLALTISSGATHKYLSSLAQGKSVVHLHNADIQSVSAKFPTKREQEKIHLLFGKIDTLITLHQRKLEKLQNIKKSCLEKMFV